MREIELEPDEYLASLRITDEGPVEVVDVDGAVLYRVADDHFLVFACLEHPHRGHEYLRRVLPPTWIAFAEARNSAIPYSATHYGPDLDEEAPDA